MTLTQPAPAPHSAPPAREHRGRTAIVFMLILSLLATAAMQTLARRYHDTLQPRRSTQPLKGIDTFTLGLLLGGLRGPLVMILWTQSENQKTERNLENVETQIELIRMLQPEFMSVHIFQIWNKAYNLSVQMASLPNRYSTILDAIRYGKKVDQEYHDDINIMVAIAEVYYNKFGTGADRFYYIDRVRRETRYQPNAAAQQRASDSATLPRSHPSMLDEQGNILPQYADDLRYLLPYDKVGGFPDGISPLALAYNYHKRAQVIMATTSQRHLQLSDSVVDSRAAIDLRTWAEEEWGRARTKELITFGLRTRQELFNMDRITLVGLHDLVDFAGKVPDKSPSAQDEIRLALFAYERCARVSTDAEAEYQRHISNQAYAYSVQTYDSHIATVRALHAEALADRDYLALAADATGLLPLSRTTPNTTPQALRKKAIAEYQDAIDAYYRLLLRYYVEGQVADQLFPQITQRELGKAYTRGQIVTAPPSVYPKVLSETVKYLKDHNSYAQFYSEAEEFIGYLKGAQAHQQQLQKLP